jgi:hypothetical protein
MFRLQSLGSRLKALVEVLEGKKKNQKPVPLCRPPYLNYQYPKAGLVQCPLSNRPQITSPDASRRMPVGSGNFGF